MGRRLVSKAASATVRATSAIEAQAFEHKRDLGALAAENAALRQQLYDAGLIPVKGTTEEWWQMFRSAAHVMRTAQLALNELGTSKEMLVKFT